MSWFRDNCNEKEGELINGVCIEYAKRTTKLVLPSTCRILVQSVSLLLLWLLSYQLLLLLSLQ